MSVKAPAEVKVPGLSHGRNIFKVRRFLTLPADQALRAFRSMTDF